MVKHSEHSDSETYGWIPSVPCEEMNFPVALDWLIDRPQFWTVQQYIGKNDKNGKKIFEGDIVRWSNTFMDTICEVYFDFCSCGFRLNDNVGNMRCNLSGINPENLEVLGNIFENENLLK